LLHQGLSALLLREVDGLFEQWTAAFGFALVQVGASQLDTRSDRYRVELYSPGQIRLGLGKVAAQHPRQLAIETAPRGQGVSIIRVELKRALEFTVCPEEIDRVGCCPPEKHQTAVVGKKRKVPIDVRVVRLDGAACESQTLCVSGHFLLARERLLLLTSPKTVKRLRGQLLCGLLVVQAVRRLLGLRRTADPHSREQRREQGYVCFSFHLSACPELFQAPD
jgi:hypothetical protein